MTSPKPSRLWKCFDGVVLAAAFALLAKWSWRKWPDVLVDYGLQLYTPWQLSLGEVLYRDVKYLAGGPLSQYSHALLFKLFGVSLTVLIVANLALLAVTVFLLYRLFSHIADRGTALTICLGTLFVFAFSQFIRTGNYNFVCPYTYETTHGLLLSILALACLARWIETGRAGWAFSGGVFFGAVFLTKPDLFLALSVAVIAALMVRRSTSAARSAPVRESLTLLFGALLPVGAFVVYFSVAWDFRQAIQAVTGSWLPLLSTPAAQNNFYKWCLGLDRPAERAISVVRHSAMVLASIAVLVACARCFQRKNLVMMVGAALAMLLLVYGAATKYRWLEIGSSLAPLTLLGLIFIGWKFWNARHSPEKSKVALPLLWAVFALFLLAKMGLATRIWHYGFYLALPAAAFLVYSVAFLLPRELIRFGIAPRMFRVLAALVASAGVFQLFNASDLYYDAKNLPVAQEGDRICAFNREVTEVPYAIDAVVEWLKKNTSVSNTVATLPEGVMVNYLARRANSTPYAGFTFPEIQAYGESNMVAAYVQQPPDYVVLIHRDSSEYGVGYFGTDSRFGYETMNWVRTNYSTALLLGHDPLQTNRFGIKILRRNGLVATTSDAQPPKR